MDFLYLTFYGCLRLRFLDVETTLARVFLYLRSAEYSVVMCRTWPGNYSDLTVASSQYDILLCSETLVSDMHHVLLVSGSVARSCCVGARCLGHVGWLHKFEMVTEHFANPNLSVVVAKCWFLGFVV